MLEVEPYLMELIIKLADMRTPITTSQGLQLANSLIKGTSVDGKRSTYPLLWNLWKRGSGSTNSFWKCCATVAGECEWSNDASNQWWWLWLQCHSSYYGSSMILLSIFILDNCCLVLLNCCWVFSRHQWSQRAHSVLLATSPVLNEAQRKLSELLHPHFQDL